MRRALTLALALLTSPALAEDAALLIGNDRYDSLGRVPGAARLVRAEDDLRALGFAVTALTNGRAANVPEQLDSFADTAAGAERLVVALSGRFVTSGGQSWLLLPDAEYPTLFGLGSAAVSLEALLGVLGSRPGQALLVLGYDDGEEDEFGPHLREGIGALSPPQGVTVIVGDVGPVEEFVREALTEPEAELMEAARAERLTVLGYAPSRWVLTPAAEDVVALDPIWAQPQDTEADRLNWTQAEQADTAEAYRAYLDAFPNGSRADEARDRVEAILAEPFRGERLGEEALGLSRNDRREVQRNLTLLDFNTRGIDGIFGPGSRTAIQNWQQQNGYPQTTYLTREQVSRLAGQAARRQSELAAAAAAEAAALARADRAFWDETGARGDEAGYRAYLGRYPQGVYAAIARDALATIDEARQAEAAAEDRAAWDRARADDSEASYRAYLQDFPGGAFRIEAQAALAILTQPTGPDPDALAQAEAQERALRLNPITVRLVEAKLADLDLNPGVVDGRLDGETRTAIRAYQDARGLPVTGYLTEATVVRLLADTIGEFRQ